MSGKNSILGLADPKIAEYLDIFYTYEHLKFHAQPSLSMKKFNNLGLRLLLQDQTLHCLLYRLHLVGTVLLLKHNALIFWLVTVIILGVPMFRTFTVYKK